MNHYWCPHCEVHFNDEDLYFYFMENDNRPRLKWVSEDECPWCGKEDLEPARKCEVCWDWFGEDMLSGGVCQDCLWNDIVVNRPDIVLGYLNWSKESFGEYAAEIVTREYKKKTARCSQHQTV